jgi:solute carrier family 45 protein 1/2/4
LVPNGEDIGRALGDIYPSHGEAGNRTTILGNGSDYSNATVVSDANYPHPWGVLFTVLGTILLDFDADACQSPSRAYLLDVTLPGKRDIAHVSAPNSQLVFQKIEKYRVPETGTVSILR